MAYLALYRQFRPSGFDKLVGQEHIVKTLVNQIKTDRIGHAYLFCGTRGTGKTSTAKIFAKAINCLSPVNGSPCGECEVCKKLEDASNLDILEMDAASNNGVENIRELRDKIQYPPVAGRYKVYIIDEVHMLSGGAFNALLKTLEEPPKHAVFILATTEVHKLPATILSRCLRFDFKLVPTRKIAEHIASIYDSIGKKYQSEAVSLIARAGEGSLRDAMSIADMCVSCSGDVLTYEDVLEVLGGSDRGRIEELLEGVFTGNTGKAISIVDELTQKSKSVMVLNRDICSLIRDILVIKTCNNSKAILEMPDDKMAELTALSEKAEVNQLLRALELFSSVEADMKYSTHPKIIFETAVVKAALPRSDYNIDSVLTRLNKIEDQLKQLSSGGEMSANRSINAQNAPVLPDVGKLKAQMSAEFEASINKAVKEIKEDVAKQLAENDSLIESKLKQMAQSQAAELVVDASKAQTQTQTSYSKHEEKETEKQLAAQQVNSSEVKAIAEDDEYGEQDDFFGSLMNFSPADIPPEEDMPLSVAPQKKVAQTVAKAVKPKTEENVGSRAEALKVEEKAAKEEKIAQMGQLQSAAPQSKPSVDSDKEIPCKFWGLVLRKMRANTDIMLWVACQDIEVKIKGSKLLLICGGNNEYEYVKKSESRAKIAEYTKEYGNFEIVAVSKDGEVPEVDENLEKVKKFLDGENFEIKD